MKKLFGIACLSGMIILTACEPKATESTSKVYLHLQASFGNDEVKIDIDGNQVYLEDSVTTIQVLGVADTDSTEQNNGTHEIKVTVNNSIMHTENFTLDQPLWIGINYFQSAGYIQFNYSDEPYIYD